MIITYLFQKQQDAVRAVILSNLYEFVKTFFDEDELEFLPDLNFEIFFGEGVLIVQEQWFDENEVEHYQDVHVSFEDYNNWFKGLNNDISEGQV
ncbi:MAG: hypothetical protein GY804_15355 [Alphaproteobacteria bacterium]|nr:hypothetical protein [Alphaproteobacteria bacterium]